VVERGGGQEIDLRRYLSGLARRKLLILSVIVGMVGAAVLLSAVQEPVYQAEAEILLQPRGVESPFETGTRPAQTNSDVTVATEIEILKSPAVRREVEKKLGPVPEVRAERAAETLIVEVKVETSDPGRAADVANAYATTYIDMRRAQAAGDVLGAGKQVEAKIAELQRELDQLDRRIAESPASQRPTLTPAREALAGQQALFRKRLDELQVEAALKSGGAQLVAAATRPSSPVRPRPVRNGVLALAVGTLLGVALASLLEYLDDSIRSKDDLARAAPGLPVIGLIPHLPKWRRARAGPHLVSASPDDAPAAEAYRALRTSVQMLGVDRPLTTIQITSPGAGEGKTSTVTNLAAVVAGAGQKVVVVDCDLRRPRAHEPFGLSGDMGFTSVLAASVPLTEAVQSVPGCPGLSLLASGPIPPNPSELLGSRRTSEVLFQLQSTFDVVLIDSPPVLPVTDATVLSAWVDATVVVVTAGATTGRQVRAAVDLLRQAAAPIAGTVLNRAPTEEQYGYEYGYRYLEDGRRRKGRRQATSPQPAAADGPSRQQAADAEPATPPAAVGRGEDRTSGTAGVGE
jgi:succinoglycan biosynthesis transport protein ExoP